MDISLRHTGIVVRDLDAALDFYTGFLGFTVVRRMDESGEFLNNMLGLKEVMVTTVKMEAPGGGMLELLQFANPSDGPDHPPTIHAPGFTHVAFTVGDLEKTYDRMKSSGVPFNAPPQKAPDGGAMVTFCRDPEGNYLELVEVLTP